MRLYSKLAPRNRIQQLLLEQQSFFKKQRLLKLYLTKIRPKNWQLNQVIPSCML